MTSTDKTKTSSEVNGVDLDALSKTVDAVRGDRRLGEVTFAVNGTWENAFRLRSETGAVTQGGESDATRAGKFKMASDEPEALLGSDTAASPAEYILQALAGCYTVTLTANAASKGIKLEAFRLQLSADFDLASFLGIAPEQHPGASQVRVNVELEAPEATREELEELVELVQQRSPVRDTLARPVDVVTTLA